MKKLICIALAALLVMTCFAGCQKNEKETIVVGYTIYAPMNYLDDAGNAIAAHTPNGWIRFYEQGSHLGSSNEIYSKIL